MNTTEDHKSFNAFLIGFKYKNCIVHFKLQYIIIYVFHFKIDSFLHQLV